MLLRMKVLLNAFKILGLCPMSINKSGKNDMFFKYSSLGTFYNICLIIFHLLSVLYFILFLDKNKISYHRRHAVATISNSCIYLSYLVVTIIALEFTLKQNTCVKLGNELHDLNTSLMNLESKYRKKRNLEVKQVAIVGVNMFLWTTMMANEFFFINPEILVYYICEYIGCMIISWVCVQYVWILILLTGIMETVNELFSKFQNNTYRQMQVVNLQDFCLKLHETAQKISNFYSVTMVGCITKIFYGITIDVYYIIRPAVSNKPIASSLSDLSSAMWLVMNLLSLSMVTFFVTTFDTEVFY